MGHHWRFPNPPLMMVSGRGGFQCQKRLDLADQIEYESSSFAGGWAVHGSEIWEWPVDKHIHPGEAS
jgi:hypothetical protein